MLTIEGTEPAQPQSHPTVNLGASDRNLLELDYSGKYRLPKQALNADEPQVIRILAIKVNFVKEVPDDPLSTGDGNFDLRTKEQYLADEGHLIDPTPHNSDYFNAHLRAHAEYWRVVSNGRLRLEWELYPVAKDSAYQLDETMAYYGLPAPQYGLGELYYDAFMKADVDTGLHFYDEATQSDRYDAYIIFRPGSDQQNNLGGVFGPDTPADLYTGFVKLGLPFTVDEGRVTIYEGMVMPETASQDNRVVALNAVFAHEFGHQLGLVDLYDSRTFITLCGDFALMDNNGLGVNIDFGETVPVLVQGVMPIFPCAWSRAYLGFVDIVEVTDANNAKLAAAELDTSLAQMFMIPINQEEYFLLENRQTDLDGLEPTAVQADSLTDVILWPRAAIEGQSRNNREYDFLIPGSGMLIWHVDESVAYMDYDGDGINNFDDNHLQWFHFPEIDEVGWDNHRRFLTLEEADGIVDFGGEYFAGYGDAEDMFNINNNSRFGPDTNPNSDANNNAYTGIVVDDISAAFRVMSCDIRVEGPLSGWPNYIGSGPQPLLACNLDGTGGDEILTAVDRYILAYHFDGTPMFSPLPGEEVTVERQTFYGDRVVRDTLAVLGRVAEGERINRPLAAADLDDDGFMEIVAVTNENNVACFTSRSLSYQGDAFKLFETAIAAEITTAPLIMDWDTDVSGREILLLTADDVFIVLDADGDEIARETISTDMERLLTDDAGSFAFEAGPSAGRQLRGAVAADFDQNGAMEYAEVFFGGHLRINYDQPVEVDIGEPVFSGISAADIDADGFVEVVFCGDSKIYAFNHNGTPVNDFPITVNHYIPAGPIRANPTLLDLEGDGRLELFVGTSNGELAGFDLYGNLLPGFPRAPGGSVDYTAVAATGDGGEAGVFALTREGGMTAYPLGSLAGIEWNAPYGDPANLGSYVSQVSGSREFAEAIGYLYNYPNPAKEVTTVRFGLRDSGPVKMKLYNMAGDLVFETEIEGQASVDNEYQLDCSPFTSGVYFCLLETSGGENEHCSIAILK
jgi:M6 family metalloprotease-like protein